jgi:hypothetical protein
MSVSLAGRMTALGQHRPIMHSMKMVNKSSHNSLMLARNNAALILTAGRGLQQVLSFANK